MHDFESEELKTLYFQREPQLLAMAEKEAWDYLVDFVAWSVSSTMIQKWILLFLIVLIHLRFSLSLLGEKFDWFAHRGHSYVFNRKRTKDTPAVYQPEAYGRLEKMELLFGG